MNWVMGLFSWLFGHRHQWQVDYTTGNTIAFVCANAKCRQKARRAMTDRERVWFGDSFAQMIHPPQHEDVHAVWHDFEKVFGSSGSWKFTGYSMMEKVEEWAKKFPDHVNICLCDDMFYTSSSLVLIQHKGATKYHGLTVVCIPQSTGEPPVAFFLYPGHQRNLLNTMQNHQTAIKELHNRNRAVCAKEARQLRRLVEWPPKRA